MINIPNRCYKCDTELTPERIITQFDMGVSIDRLTCVEHSEIQRPIGFMSESSDINGKASRKTGYELNILRPNDVNFKENFRQMKRGIRRAR